MVGGKTSRARKNERIVDDLVAEEKRREKKPPNGAGILTPLTCRKFSIWSVESTLAHLQILYLMERAESFAEFQSHRGPSLHSTWLDV